MREKSPQLIITIFVILFVIIFCSATLGIAYFLFMGSGDVVSEEREVGDFDELVLEGSGNVYITQGDELSLKVEVPEDVLPDITTDVEDSTLTLKRKYSDNRGFFNIDLSWRNEVNYYVTVKDITKLTISGSGLIRSENQLNAANLELIINGSGDMDLDVLASELVVKINGSGNIDLSGEIEKQEISIKGSGNYNAKNLKSKDCEVMISSSGDAHVNVSDNLDIQIDGSGDVTYGGNPEVKQEINGSGSVKKR